MLVSVQIYAQDPIFSQFYNSPLQINPAFAGISEDPVVSFNYRDQSPGIVSRFGFPNGTYTTYAAAWDQFFPELNSGFGISLIGDTAGEGSAGGSLLSTVGVSGIYSYNLKLDASTFIKFGLEAGFAQTRVNWGELCFLDQLQSNLGSTCQELIGTSSVEDVPESFSNSYIDVSMGMLFYSQRYYGGVSIKHLNTPDYGFYTDDANLVDGLPLRFTVHGGYHLTLDPTLKRTFGAYVAPNFLYVRQGGLSQLNVGAIVGYQHFFVGGWFRFSGQNSDAAIISAGTSVGKIKFSYSFDVTVSRLSVNNTRGAHEVGIIYNFAPPGKEKFDINDCFSIFR
jgi:type IX secretion system PorP/SprF family membrane protein